MNRSSQHDASFRADLPRKKKRGLLRWSLIVFAGVFAFALIADGVDRIIPGWEEREAARAIERAEREEARAEREAVRAERRAAADAERAERQVRAEIARAEEARREDIRQAACRRTFSCWANEHLSTADRACRRGLEDMARYQARWTTRMGERRFSRFESLDGRPDVIVYSGDRIELQNGFGVWQTHTYACAYNPGTGAATPIEMRPGRL